MLEDRLKDISEIRNLMEQQTKFLSLSGLSGVGAGVVALLGAFVTYEYLCAKGIYQALQRQTTYTLTGNELLELLSIAVGIMVCALAVAIFFSYRMAKQKKLPFWNKTAQRLLIDMAIPLVVGGIFSLALAIYSLGGLVPGATLIFYGMSLMNGGKYTQPEIRYLGLCQMLLGLVAAFFIGYGLFFWAIGFGILHIVYGLVLYQKYERN